MIAVRCSDKGGSTVNIMVHSAIRLNIFGDAVRDLLDPRLRGGGGSSRSRILTNDARVAAR